jgi:guanylate kinase
MGKKRHEEIGEKLANIDYLFLTNKNFNNEIRKGIMRKNGRVKVITGTYQYLADSIREILKKGDTILFEGKEAGIVLKQLL